MKNNLIKSIGILKKGGIGIYPTDTAFGIGCRIDNPASVSRLFELRKRPLTQAVPVLADGIEMASKYFRTPLPDVVRHLMESYWPGALTIVYYANNSLVYPLIRGGTETVGIRMPDHQTALRLISGTGLPLVGASANFHGEKTPYTFKDLDPGLTALVDFVIEGSCKTGNVSTVVDCTGNGIKIIRQGAIKIP